MSDSRLEKFIYAICSMDVTDLPVPLSRIEKIWNCLITGETPDFEPLSRNEKYLMAMLDRYDISNLPAPMSRGEKLLYKIAVGETDLSDVPGYLSRYEELLKYLIENGGISGGDFEYVLYTLNQSLSTLYQTVEKPVKSAILKGQTLVNHTTDNLYITVAPLGVETITQNMLALKNNTEYIAIFRMLIGSDTSVYLHLFNNNWVFVKNFSSNLSPTKNYIKFTTPSSSEIKHLQLENKGASSFDITDMMVIEYEDGMENWDIPYFEGMQSVKMPVLKATGKNLVDLSTSIYGEGLNNVQTGFIKINPNKTFIASMNNQHGSTVTFYTQNKEPITTINGFKVTSPSNAYYLRWVISTQNTTADWNTFQIEEGTRATSYEPYKSNILTVNEEVELRGIGDVKDELNLLTGELTQRVGEIMFDGSENWKVHNTYGYVLNVANLGIKNINTSASQVASNFMCDSLPTVSLLELTSKNKNGISPSIKDIDEVLIYFTDIGENNLTGLRQKLASNPITIIAELKQPSIKTVDLTTVDQDGQPTKLKTFNDITHVEINADNIIPSVDVEVATKINEALSTMGPQQLNISNTQNKLGQAIDEQTENTDAAMIATTEIYEQTL